MTAPLASYRPCIKGGSYSGRGCINHDSRCALIEYSPSSPSIFSTTFSIPNHIHSFPFHRQTPNLPNTPYSNILPLFSKHQNADLRRYPSLQRHGRLCRIWRRYSTQSIRRPSHRWPHGRKGSESIPFSRSQITYKHICTPPYVPHDPRLTLSFNFRVLDFHRYHRGPRARQEARRRGAPSHWGRRCHRRHRRHRRSGGDYHGSR